MKHPLAVLAVPIGNLEDISKRAISYLADADYIFAEDTRRTKKLIELLKISTNASIKSYREQNHDIAAPLLKKCIDSGAKVVLVSDSGTPAISDPGYLLIEDLRQHGYEVIAVPGPSSVIAALCIAGISTEKFLFLGFFPKKGNKRFEELGQARHIRATWVLLESPQRITKTLKILADKYGDSLKVAAIKEISKLHERTFYGNISEVYAQVCKSNTKGEWVLVGRFVE